MLAEERWNSILDLVDEKKSVSVQELTDLLGTSESTIRRDLTQLDHLKRLIKVHGGAVCLDTQYVLKDQTMTEKYGQMSREKQMIAEYAAGLIGPEDFVYIDAGTTTERLVECITETGAVYMTNSIAHAKRLLQKGCRVLVPGGELKPATEALVGPDTLDTISRYNFTIGFWGANGVSLDVGFTTPEANEARIKQLSMERTRKKYMLCTSDKFTRVSPVSFAAIDAASIITDRIRDSRYRSLDNIVEVEKS